VRIVSAGWPAILPRAQLKNVEPYAEAYLDDPKTKELYAQYLKTQSQILETYQGKPILDIALKQWMQKYVD
jgi:hypothetical protein